MAAFAEQLRSFAEEPAPMLGPPPPPTRRITTPGYAIELSPSPSESLTSCVRTSPEGLDATIAEIRNTLRTLGVTRNVWRLGPSCAPSGLQRLLCQRGFVPASTPPFEPRLTVMALTEEPALIVPDGVEARLCVSQDEFVQALQICVEAFAQPEEAAAAWLRAAASLWTRQDGESLFTHIAYLGGEPVGMGFSESTRAGVFLNGSGVRSSARGRGVYRALLRSRWQHAVKLGRPGLAVHAGALSRPVLDRCGFRAICQLELLEDRSLASAD